ncbi:MAG: 50S ribosomal protein L25/general stress protein Ctc [Bacteroidetes bacterium]|nr:50S ribosomal protein L25/general stress protein Ctc [Bacteroidota bacterium]MDA1120019.1 50S ribosomal protein L25/general stress protein Ctc [Bacteroidota bacterium]
METLEIIGYKRANLGKTEAKKLRAEGNVPCVLYGAGDQVHFYSPGILFKELVYTPEVHFINMDIEGTEYRCVLQDIQFHPVNDMILHADFLVLDDKKPIKMEVPIHLVGIAPGIQEGGKLFRKTRLIHVKALPPNMPAHIDVHIDTLRLGKSIKIGDLIAETYEILNSPAVTIVSVQIPRVLVTATEGDEGEEIEGEVTQEADSTDEGETGESPTESAE